MLRSDLKEFLESFFQVESMIKYALRFHMQSMFTVPYYLDRQDYQKRAQEASYAMLKTYQAHIDKCLRILRDYDHLVPHDSSTLDCSRIKTFGCLFRIYGVTMLSLGGFIVGGGLYFKRRIDAVMEKVQRKKI